MNRFYHLLCLMSSKLMFNECKGNLTKVNKKYSFVLGLVLLRVSVENCLEYHKAWLILRINPPRDFVVVRSARLLSVAN